MAEKIEHNLRMWEVVSPFGVGAIIDVLGESLIALDTSTWDKKRAPLLYCDRLMARLGNGELREPPTHGEGDRPGGKAPGLDYQRFPAWRFCERCEKLSPRSIIQRGKFVNTCECGGWRVPIRFVAVCKKGSHVRDIPWFQWAHRGSEAKDNDKVRKCNAYNELVFRRSASSGEGLQSLVVHCRGCGRSRALSELSSDGSLLRDGIKCEGRQPWQPCDDGFAYRCDSPLVAVQRGATGNYLAQRLSALDIPEELPPSFETADQIRKHPYFSRLVKEGSEKSEMILAWIAEELDVSADLVLEIARSNSGRQVDEALLSLKDGEWAAFLKKFSRARDLEDTNFVVDTWRPENESAADLSSLLGNLEGVGQVRKVREVRALTGFQRYNNDADTISVDLGPDGRWKPTYPAIELFGEGIFLRFNEERLAAWESIPAVQARARILGERYTSNPSMSRLEYPEPRYLALHTLAHLLIRRLAFSSGYSSASLQERVYANSKRADKTAGILIYTAAGDVQGTLGGLVRLGAEDHLIPLILQALDDADFCSNDPVCIESDSQGAGMMNLSACHGCALVSETSCESQNRLLDRQLVLGGGDVPGLLEEVLEDARRNSFAG